MAKRIDDPKKITDQTKRHTYNTYLPGIQMENFSRWLSEESKRRGRPISMDLDAYDVVGFYGANEKVDDRGHGTDYFKKPYHPTFSDQSKYHGIDNYTGGQWTDSSFIASPTNMKFARPEDMLWQMQEDPGINLQYGDTIYTQDDMKNKNKKKYSTGGYVSMNGSTDPTQQPPLEKRKLYGKTYGPPRVDNPLNKPRKYVEDPQTKGYTYDYKNGVYVDPNKNEWADLAGKEWKTLGDIGGIRNPEKLRNQVWNNTNQFYPMQLRRDMDEATYNKAFHPSRYTNQALNTGINTFANGGVVGDWFKENREGIIGGATALAGAGLTFLSGGALAPVGIGMMASGAGALAGEMMDGNTKDARRSRY